MSGRTLGELPHSSISFTLELLLLLWAALQDARKEMEAGTWLCPHCYEDEHPDEGWMCNSSICMKRRGYKPTGIAIYDAQQRGFPSVAHWLQSQLLKRSGKAAEETAAAPAGEAAAVAKGAKGGDDAVAAPCDSSDAGSAAVADVKASSKASSSSKNSSRSPAACEDSVEAPATPLRGAENAAAAAEGAAAAGAAVGGKGGRVTRRNAAAAAALGHVVDVDEHSSKRACVSEAAGSRRSLRFRK